MNSRFPYAKWCVAAALLVMILAVAACTPFGKQPTESVPPTETPLPTDTPPPAAPTATATRVVQTPTPTLMATPTPQPEPPTPTPTPEPQPQAGGDQPAGVSVSYVVTRAPIMGDVIQNGSFEDGFQENGVAEGWTSFDNGDAVYTWVDEVQPIHVSHDSHAQLMRIKDPSEPDRYIGIYQTVDVIAGETYTLALHGLIRSSSVTKSDNPYGHRIQWAIDYKGGTNWYEMTLDWGNWTDPGWNDVMLEDKNPEMNYYVKQIVPTADKLTLYIRGWTKWPVMGSEAKFYVDGVFLRGPVPGEETVVTVTKSGESVGGEGMPTTGGTAIWIPVTGMAFVLGFAVWEVRKVWLR